MDYQRVEFTRVFEERIKPMDDRKPGEPSNNNGLYKVLGYYILIRKLD